VEIEIPQWGKDLISMCLEVNPEKRASAEELLSSRLISYYFHLIFPSQIS
jgi:serine/threonine protein kinase